MMKPLPDPDIHAARLEVGVALTSLRVVYEKRIIRAEKERDWLIAAIQKMGERGTLTEYDIFRRELDREEQS